MSTDPNIFKIIHTHEFTATPSIITLRNEPYIVEKYFACSKDEYEIYKHLNNENENVLKCFEYHNHVLFLERIGNGINLSQVDCVLDFKEAIELIGQVVDGLSFIHSKNIIHHDFAPANILVELSDHKIKRLVISDFGVSEFLTDVNPENRVRGRNDCAPEQHTNDDITLAFDIYGLANIICRILWLHVKHFKGYDGCYTTNTKLALVYDLVTLCREKNPKNRPTIQQINEFFEKMKSLL